MPSKDIVKTKYARRYSPKLKFQVVLELLKGENDVAQIAKAYGVHPKSVYLWRDQLVAKGPQIFAEKNLVSQYEKKIADLERMVGRKEVEINLLKNFLSRED